MCSGGLLGRFCHHSPAMLSTIDASRVPCRGETIEMATRPPKKKASTGVSYGAEAEREEHIKKRDDTDRRAERTSEPQKEQHP